MVGEIPVNSTLDLNVWDFPGQHDFLTTKRQFLGTRTTFFVIWRIKEGEKGIKGLQYWFSCLQKQLARADNTLENTVSVIVIGNGLDEIAEEAQEIEREHRKEQVVHAAHGMGLVNFPIQYYEVSCSTLKHIQEVKQVINATLLSRSHMGEYIPASYLKIRDILVKLRDETMDNVPVVSIDKIIGEYYNLNPNDPELDTLAANFQSAQFPGISLPPQNYLDPALNFASGAMPASPDPYSDFGMFRRALMLLSEWGECVYFGDSAELSTTVILDPLFLTKEVMDQLFNPSLSMKYEDSVNRHSEVVSSWSAYKRNKGKAGLATAEIARNRGQSLLELAQGLQERKERSTSLQGNSN